MPTALVTGSSGLVGSACVRRLDALGWTVHGIDGNQRRVFFGADGDVQPNTARLCGDCPRFIPHGLDVRCRGAIASLVRDLHPDLIIHAAAQPSHDWAAEHPFEDFAVNAEGTLNLLEAVRRFVPEASFCFLSTNKVYGDAPNDPRRYPIMELPTRYENHFAFDERTPIDASTHSLFGCSKLAADVYVQEYGRYFGLSTVCFRAGCLTGGAHAGAEQHGFLAYLARCCREGRTYTVYGHKGKQVRDQLHADDVATACLAYHAKPRPGEVYNLGGGRDNSVSVLEAIDLVERATGKPLEWRYNETARKGDHVCYISDCSKFKAHYPGWSVTKSLSDIIEELAQCQG